MFVVPNAAVGRHDRTRVIFHVYKVQYLPTTWRRNAMNLPVTS